MKRSTIEGYFAAKLSYEEWKKAYGDKVKLRVTLYAPDLETRKQWEQAAAAEGLPLTRWILKRLQASAEAANKQPSPSGISEAAAGVPAHPSGTVETAAGTTDPGPLPPGGKTPEKRGHLSRRGFLKYAIVGAAAAGAGVFATQWLNDNVFAKQRPAESAHVVSLLAPFDYFPGSILGDFGQWMREHKDPSFEGVRVTLYTREDQVDEILAADEVCDLILVGNAHAGYLRNLGRIRTLDPLLLTNRSHLAPDYRDNFIDTDAGGKLYAVPVAWGTDVLWFREDLLSPTSVEDLGWDSLWASTIPGTDGGAFDVSNRRIVPLEGRQIRGVALKKLGWDAQKNRGLAPTAIPLNPDAPYDGLFQWSVNDVDAAKDPILNPAVEFLKTLATHGWESDPVLVATEGSPSASPAPPFRQIVPKQGAGRSADVIAVAFDAPNPDTAQAFADFLLDPAESALLATWNLKGTTNEDAAPFYLPPPGFQPSLYPNPSVSPRLEWYRDTGLSFG